MAQRTTCLCGEKMRLLADTRRRTVYYNEREPLSVRSIRELNVSSEIWGCPNCGRLLLKPYNEDWQSWYFPEAGLNPGWDKRK